MSCFMGGVKLMWVLSILTELLEFNPIKNKPLMQ